MLVSLSILGGLVWNSDVNPFVMAENIQQNTLDTAFLKLESLRLRIYEMQAKYSNENGTFTEGVPMTPDDKATYEEMLIRREMLWKKVGLKK